MRIFHASAQEGNITLEKITEFNGIVQIPIGDFYGIINKIDADPAIRTRKLTDFFGKITFLGISYDWQTIHFCFDAVPVKDIEAVIGTKYIRLYAMITTLDNKKNEIAITFATNLEALPTQLSTKFRTFFTTVFQNFIGAVKWELSTVDTKTTKPATEVRYPTTIAIPATFKKDAIYFAPIKDATKAATKGASL